MLQFGQQMILGHPRQVLYIPTYPPVRKQDYTFLYAGLLSSSKNIFPDDELNGDQNLGKYFSNIVGKLKQLRLPLSFGGQLQSSHSISQIVVSCQGITLTTSFISCESLIKKQFLCTKLRGESRHLSGKIRNPTMHYQSFDHLQ